MPINYSHYPSNWKQISKRIRERANNYCEWCGVQNGAIGARDKHGEWRNDHDIHCLNSDIGYALYGEFPNMIKIVLTVAHLDHDTTNNSDSNLQALCQLCHNRYDAPIRAKHAAKTRKKKKLEATLATGQTMMEV